MFNFIGTMGFIVAIKCFIVMDRTQVYTWDFFGLCIGFGIGMTIYEKSRGLE